MGELVRVGQEEGRIRKVGDDTRTDLVGRGRLGQGLESPKDAAGLRSRDQLIPIYRMAEASPEDFNAAIEDAKAEGNLSRANDGVPAVEHQGV